MVKNGDSRGEGHGAVWVIVKALERIGERVEERYLLRKSHTTGQWQVLGGSPAAERDPNKAAKQMVEVQLGGLTVGWDLMVEPLSASPADYRGHVFQGFFVRPVWEFHYLWAGDAVRWFSREKSTQGKDVDRETQRLFRGLDRGEAMPKTWSQYLHRCYSEAWRHSLDAMQPWSGELAVQGIAPQHRAGLGAVLRRRLLAGDWDGERMLRRVGFTERENGVQLALKWCGQGDRQDRGDQAFLEQAWESLAQACDADLINGGGLAT